jgi:hypothetical protein
MTKSIVDLFQSIKVQQDKREFAFGTLGSADLCVQDLKKTAMIGQAGKRIAGSLAAKTIFQGALFGDVDNDDLVTNKISTVVIDPAAAEPGS